MKLRTYCTGIQFFTTSLSLLLLVNMAPTAAATVVQINANPNPVVQGQNVTIAAGVSYDGSAGRYATGTIAINATCLGAVTPLGAITLGSATSTSPGAGTLAVSSFPCIYPNLNSLVAVYDGDAKYPAGVSAALLETVLAGFTPTGTSLGSSVNPSTAGQSATFSARLTYTRTNLTTPTETATFTHVNSGNVLGAGNVQTSGTGEEFLTGVAIAIPSLAAGSYAIQAAYSGNNTYAPSTSTIVNQVVQSQ